MSAPSPPIVTFTSDFGDRDTYVAEMKAAVLRLCPQAVLVDITHSVAPHDIAHGAYLLSRAVPSFPPSTVHVAVVDPGVGGPRRPLLVRAGGQCMVGPDNGLLDAFLDTGEVRELDPARVVPGLASPTFHGRDVFAPAAARLGRGEDAAAFSSAASRPVRLPRPEVDSIVHVDRFGNCVTSITATRLDAGATPGRIAVLSLRGRAIRNQVRTYEEAPPGEPVFLVGSAGHIEIALRQASAADLLGLNRGDQVKLDHEEAPC